MYLWIVGLFLAGAPQPPDWSELMRLYGRKGSARRRFLTRWGWLSAVATVPFSDRAGVPQLWAALFIGLIAVVASHGRFAT